VRPTTCSYSPENGAADEPVIKETIDIDRHQKTQCWPNGPYARRTREKPQDNDLTNEIIAVSMIASRSIASVTNPCLVITGLDAKANRAACCSRLLEIGDNMVSSGVLNVCFLPLDPQPRPPPRGKAMLELVPQIISCLSFLVCLFPPDARKQKPGSEGSKGVSAPRQLFILGIVSVNRRLAEGFDRS
jgi:hypothetical protein